jgi:hypothetical protein
MLFIILHNINQPLISEKNNEQMISFCTSKQTHSEIDSQLYTYTALFELPSSRSFMINLSGLGIIPTFKLSQKILSFGECSSNEKKDLQF